MKLKLLIIPLTLIILLTACSSGDSEQNETNNVMPSSADGFTQIEEKAAPDETTDLACYVEEETYCAYYYYSYEEVPLCEPLIFSREELILENVLRIANVRRQLIHETDMERIYSWIAAREPKIIDATRLVDSTRRNNLTAEQAAYDIRTLFLLMRHMYAAYHYFGGDEVFIPIMEEMLEEISGRERWTDDRLFSLIQDRLGPIIIDKHFIINRYSGSTFNNPQNTFVWNEPFDRSERGFQKRATGLYVSYVYGHDIYELFRLTVNEAGEFFYAPVILRPSSLGTTYSLHITFEDGGQETINLTRTTYERAHARGASSSLRFRNSIPIVCIRRMGNAFNPYAVTHNMALRVLSYIEYLRDEPVFIVDIRSNEGGASAFSYQWMGHLVGEVVPPNLNWLGFFDSRIHIPPEQSAPQRWYRHFTQRAGARFEYPPELFGRYLHMDFIAENIKFTAEEARARVVPNDQLIIVLIDRFTLSSGEIFADQFTNLENTLIIGQNTFGMLLTSSGRALYLPYSGMPVSMGQYMLVHPEGTWTDGIGLAPDVWVIGDALTAALNMLDGFFDVHQDIHNVW